jgi:hypothetical protein
MFGGTDGTLGCVVWPTYVGVCEGDPLGGVIAYGEPTGIDYERGQIVWGLDAAGDIEGRAFVKAGAGTYTHLAYFSGPEGANMVGKVQLPHPIKFDTAGVIEVYPITNPDLQLNRKQGCEV